MAKSVNIRGDVSDSFYRYKMPELLTKIEGKGNGIKTVLPNVSDVAKALARPPGYPTKFFGYELGAQTILDEKNDRYIVNGAHDASRLRELLVAFIDKFVLCPNCKNPETDLILTKNDDVFRTCKACGDRSLVDMKHKLITFITKNPPMPKPTKKSGRRAANADAEDAATAAAVAQQNGEEANGDAGSDDELTRKIAEGAKETEAAPQQSELAKSDDWSADVSKEAVAARMESLQGGINASLVLGEDDDDEGAANSAEVGVYGDYGRWLAEHRDATDAEIFQEAERLQIATKYKTVQALAQSLFTESIVTEIKTRKAVLRKLVGDSEKHQKALLGGIEYHIGTHLDLIPLVPKVLMQLYQDDIIDDEDLLKHWAGHASSKFVEKSISKQVRRAAKPFVVWLEQEDESD